MIITERGFKKPADTDPYAVKDSNDNVDNLELILDAVDLEMDQLFQSVSNGKALVAGAITDKGVNTSPTDTFAIMAGKIDAIVTDPSIGTTDAVAGDILLGKKVVSQGNLLTGSMPNNGPAVAETVNLTNHNQEYTIAQGSHSGLRKIKAVITNLAAGVIKAGVTVGGILGTFTSDATATAAQMVAGAKAYVNGVLVTGTIPSKGAQTYTPNTVNQSIAAVQYLSGSQTILGSANLVAGNIKKGVNIFSVVGTLESFENHIHRFYPLAENLTSIPSNWAMQNNSGTAIPYFIYYYGVMLSKTVIYSSYKGILAKIEVQPIQQDTRRIYIDLPTKIYPASVSIKAKMYFPRNDNTAVINGSVKFSTEGDTSIVGTSVAANTIAKYNVYSDGSYTPYKNGYINNATEYIFTATTSGAGTTRLVLDLTTVYYSSATYSPDPVNILIYDVYYS